MDIARRTIPVVGDQNALEIARRIVAGAPIDELRQQEITNYLRSEEAFTQESVLRDIGFRYAETNSPNQSAVFYEYQDDLRALASAGLALEEAHEVAKERFRGRFGRVSDDRVLDNGTVISPVRMYYPPEVLLKPRYNAAEDTMDYAWFYDDLHSTLKAVEEERGIELRNPRLVWQPAGSMEHYQRTGKVVYSLTYWDQATGTRRPLMDGDTFFWYGEPDAPD